MSYTTIRDYLGTGAPQVLAVPPYLVKDHIKVFVGGVPTSVFEWVDAGSIRLTAGVDESVRIVRQSSPNSRLSEYLNGQNLTADTLNVDSLQAFYRTQELQDQISAVAIGDAGAGGVISIPSTPMTTAEIKAALTNALTASELSSSLGERINLIDSPADTVNSIAWRVAQEAAARATAINAEIASRTAAIAAEASSRSSAIAAETAARATALAAEAAARGTAISNERTLWQASDAALASTVSTVSATASSALAIAQNEVTTRASAVAAEASARSAMLAQLTGGYSGSDLNAVSSGLLYDEKVARAAAVGAETSARTAMLAQLTGGYTGSDLNSVTSGLLYQERAARVTADSAMASQITSLLADVGGGFDTAVSYTFDSGAEGWAVPPDGAAGTVVNGHLRLPRRTPDGAAYAALSYAGQDFSLHRLFRVRIRRVGSPGGTSMSFEYSVAGAFAGAVNKAMPSFDAGGYAVVTAEMPWSTAVTTVLVAVLETAVCDASNYYELDWIAVGRNAPPASRAMVLAEQAARATAVSAEASSRETLAAQLRGSYTGTDVSGLTGGLLYNERIARQDADTALAQQILFLSAGAGEQFDYRHIWYFDTGREGWGGNVTPNASGGFLHPERAAYGYIGSPTLSYSATAYPVVKMRLKKTGTLTWDGTYRVIGPGGSPDTGNVTFAEPSWDANGYGVVTIDMSSVFTATVETLLVNFGANVTGSNYYSIDWLACGRPSPGASAAALLEEQTARASADSAEATSRQALSTKLVGMSDPSSATLGTITSGLLYDERTARSTGDSALATSITTLQGVVTSNDTAVRALVTTEETARATADSALSSSLATLQSTVTSNDTAVRALVVSEATSRANADTALSNSITALTSTVTGNASIAAALVASEASTRAAADSALGVRIDTVEASITTEAGARSAAIATVTNAVATESSARASAVTTLQATVTANNTAVTAAISTEASTRASETGNLFSKYTVKIDTNGYVTGYGLASDNNNGTPQSSFIVRADNFAIGTPQGPGTFAVKFPFIVRTTSGVVDGVAVDPGVYIDGLMVDRLKADRIDTRNLTIKDGSGNIIFSAGTDLSISRVTGKGAFATLNQITGANVSTYIAAAAIGNAQIGGDIYSDNYVSNTSGWIIQRNGYAEFSNVKVRGDVQANSVTANTVNTAGLVVNAATNIVGVTASSAQVSAASGFDYPISYDFMSTNVVTAGGALLLNITVDAQFIATRVSGSGSFVPQFQAVVLRNGSPVWSSEYVQGIPASFQAPADGPSTHMTQNVRLPFGAFVDSPSAGTHTYSLRVNRLVPEGSGAPSHSITVKSRTFTATEFKR